jgi:ribA/ribD-fused uncharacterized protein
MKISSFKEEFRFLSNFYISPIVKNGIQYKSVEHFFQAHKALDPNEHLNIARMKSAAEAKKAGRSCSLREDWEQIKDSVMWEGLVLKFAPGTNLAQMLLATEDVYLEEGNWWHDNYFGACGCKKCNGNGKNVLGKLLMKLREQLRNEK